MNEIVSGTTPTITYTFNQVRPSEITSAVLTAKRRGVIVLEKNLAAATVTEESISWTLTQEETLALGIGAVEIMLNWLDANGKRGVGKTATVNVTPNHIREVMV